jgi:transposase
MRISSTSHLFAVTCSREPQRARATELTFIRKVEALNTTYCLIQRFFRMVRKRHAELLDSWLEECLSSGFPDLQTFAEGLKREYAALRAALTVRYSNDHVA